MQDTPSQIAFALSRLALLHRAADWQAAGARGLTPTQAEILRETARRGPQRTTDLARSLGVSLPTLSDAAGALAAKGLAERRPDPADRRASRIAPTAAGAALAAALPEGAADLLAALAALPPARQGDLLRMLTDLIHALQEARAIPVQRMCATCAHFRPHAHDDPARPHHCAFVDTAFGDAALRIDCADHAPAPPDTAARTRARLTAAG
ncbi:MarR family winged helix-turn-helix transcriptional regulator [Ruixingdingia sedimenti]|uniref:MarR family winged helix-turn-helix transcriptional regulator n=1 Tax=Ruixingdingia sedimenti TaxID=3073604 RepID=A0ABU1FB88_9RHOB|nr:MarR family winged helix-turn-helix transcriptional regulator [Xinfangfangia sp. LG-4]MDR5654140.1 MarR family winged helix-turn-helix transcriptional regulator [Xinfangfangia sp. LG-4]